MPGPFGAALTLGNIDFALFEVPDDIDHFGTTQKLVVHDFPGGIRTVQPMGPFPPRIISWRGAFLEGDNGTAQERIDALNQMSAQGKPQSLQFLVWEYQVLVHDFRVMPRNQWWQPYVIELVPYQDDTASSQIAPTAPSFQSQLAQQNSGLLNQVNNAPSGVPASATGALSNFQNQLQQALQQGGAAVNSPAVQNALDTARETVKSMGSDSSPAIASWGINSNAMLGVMDNTINPLPAPIDTINAINPNLLQLALTYYGDATLWPTIARANSIATPHPVGVFQLTIPAKPV